MILNTPSQNPKSTLITGASSGIGRATALWLDERGFRVFAGLRRESDAVRLRSKGTRIEPVMLDVTQSDSISAAVERVRGLLGPEDRLTSIVNNAGLALITPMEYVDIDALRQQFEVNVVGMAAVTAAFMPLLKRPGGRVVNMSSVSGLLATALSGPYSASKYAVEAMSDALRVEVRNQGIKVSIIEPGVIATDIHDKNRMRSDSALKNLPERGRQIYGPAITKFHAGSEGRTASPPAEVAKAVHHALTSRRPKTRYPVTGPVKLLSIIGPFLTTGIRDRISGGLSGL